HRRPVCPESLPRRRDPRRGRPGRGDRRGAGRTASPGEPRHRGVCPRAEAQAGGEGDCRGESDERDDRSAVMRRLLLAAVLLTGCAAPAAQAPTSLSPSPSPARPDLLLSTTTSTQDSGLLDVLIPDFEKKSGYKVKTSAVGTG